jgi:hypothetical protein
VPSSLHLLRAMAAAAHYGAELVSRMTTTLSQNAKYDDRRLDGTDPCTATGS